MRAEANIETAKSMFRHWRDNRLKRSPIPQELWEVARQLSHEIGAHRASKELRVNYAGLKRYIEKNDPVPVAQNEPVTFTEVMGMTGESPNMNDVTAEIQIKERSIKLTFGSVDEGCLKKMVRFLSDLP